jgi:hypothetical protein
MLIESKFHDYYDSVISYGVDKTVPYNRETVDIEAPRDFHSRIGYNVSFWPVKEPTSEVRRLKFDGVEGDFSFVFRVVGFCGELFPCVCLEATHMWKGKAPKPRWFYTLKEYQEFLDRFTFHEKRFHREDGFDLDHKNRPKNFFNLAHWEPLKKLFPIHRVPAFMFGPEHFNSRGILRLNPELKKLQFMKVKAPAEAFQEIYMYISGVLGMNPRPMVEISDKDRAAAKGHDGKYSFRKPPGKKGNPRWR